ncbi:MAG TPA: hypothetical protein VFB62_02265 [Polyangiaceae bacterium]|jgi:hypothetical protein|nr:hypothetical protein [Polyangiaceae bacterium]
MSRLVAEGAEPLRLEALSVAKKFKRSWIEMAAVLVRVRQREAYLAWGYSDLYSYCAEELKIKPRTVDKLTGSYNTLERHAPELIKSDVDRPVPSCDAVDYFARLVGEHSDDVHPEAVVAELRHAVFDEARPLNALRRQFNPILCPRNEQEVARENVERASAATRRLLALLPSLKGLSRRRRSEITAVLEGLDRELATLAERSQSLAVD